MRNLIITFVLMLGFAVSAHAQTYTLDFINDDPYGADNTAGERGVADGTILNFDGIYVEFSATGTGEGEGFAYFDAGNAGLGVCTTLSGTQCDPKSDDNLTTGETLTLTFWSTVFDTGNGLVGVDLANVGIYNVVFTAEGHHPFPDDTTTLMFGMNGGALASTSMNGFGWAGMGNSFTFGFDEGLTGDQYYISSMLVSEVPEPATWLMMIIGFGIVSAATRRSRRSTSLAHTC